MIEFRDILRLPILPPPSKSAGKVQNKVAKLAGKRQYDVEGLEFRPMLRPVVSRAPMVDFLVESWSFRCSLVALEHLLWIRSVPAVS